MHFTLLAYALEQIYLQHHIVTTVSLNYCCGQYIHPILLCKPSQKQQTATFNYHATAIYASQINISLKSQICQVEDVQTTNNYVSIYASYELNAFNKVTRITGIYTFALLAYVPKQIHLPHSTYMLHFTVTVHYI